jgi:DNA-binding CsgD family transcriptional regulator
MAISMDLPASGFRFFVSVYRGEHERAFSELEAMVFGEFCQHLMQLWQQRVWESLGLSQAGEGDQRALCDAQGRLIYLGSAVAQTLARHLQDWQGEVLPGEWLDTGPAPACCPWARARRCGCSARASCWRCRSGRPPRPCRPRELAVAWRFAQGQSHKAIALELGLSPATVRTYLRDAYQRLGVDNRVALIHRLAALDGAAAS